MSGHFLNIPAVYRLGTRWIGAIPKPMAYAFSQSIAFVSYLFYKTAVDNVKGNLAQALPSLREKELSALALKVFMNYSKYLVDYGRFTSLNKDMVIDKIVSFDGKDNLEKAVAMGKGIILLTAHIGNWELGGIFFSRYGLKTNVVTVQDDNEGIDEVRKSYRDRHDVNTITIGESPFATMEIVKALNNGEIVAMLIDRYRKGLDSIETEFFGRPCRFPRGPFVLGRLTGAPIVTAFVIRDDGGYKGIVGPPLLVKEENEDAEILKKVVSSLEEHVVKYPDQWYNFTPIQIGGF
ncbi:MAG TPA: lysophospholipid acyltransferase family protein [Dissulfurispiraceae bacterium]|nr:lysophospholipid acyltransferase family protein [Dissulfurispiraceae bacterium]